MADVADIALIWLTLKDDEEFEERTGVNVCASRREPENVRFDLFKSEKAYVLFEVYKTKEGAAKHKEQAHFTEWKPWLTEHLAEDGRDRRQYKVHGGKGNVGAFRGGDVFPDNDTTIVHVSVKAGKEAEFVEATLKNQAGVLANEPDAKRFDILQQEEDPTKFVLFEVFKDAAAVSFHKTQKHFLDWRNDVQDLMQDPRKGEKVKFVPVGEKNALMKVTAKKNASFYTRAATTFLQGTPDKPACEQLELSALGEAINIAGSVAGQLEKDGIARITRITTDYPDMASGDKEHGCAHMKIMLEPVKK